MENNFDNELRKIGLLQWLFAHVDTDRLESVCMAFGKNKDKNQFINFNKNEKE